jgi:hypothetical protein
MSSEDGRLLCSPSCSGHEGLDVVFYHFGVAQILPHGYDARWHLLPWWANVMCEDRRQLCSLSCSGHEGLEVEFSHFSFAKKLISSSNAIFVYSCLMEHLIVVLQTTN